MPEKNENKNAHQGHRERLRQKVLKNGINSLAEHEVLEMILFFAFSQRNTNDLAHKLINRFGSFSEVLEAPEEELAEIEGISKTATFVLKSIPQICSYYLNDKNTSKQTIINNCESAFRFLAPKYICKTKEVSSMIFLSNSCKFLGYEVLSEGVVNSTEISARKLVELCIKYNATQVILAHNHPSGSLIPSPDDIPTTKNIFNLLQTIGVKMIDHMILARDSYFSMRSSEQFKRLLTEPKGNGK